MKRRQFIQRSVATALTAAIPWTKMVAQSAGICSSNFQEHKWVNNNRDSFKVMMSLCKETLTAFEAAAAEHKIIKLMINQNLKNAQNSFDIKTYQADYSIKAVKKMKDSLNDFKIETLFLQENKKEYELPSELNPKQLVLIYHHKTDIASMDVLDKKGNIFLTIIEKPPVADAEEEDDEDCFITTACVNILGKSDDCTELSTLRKFRDEVLRTNPIGLAMVNDYYHIAPGIVKAIAETGEKRNVYTRIYHEMILPTIDCISRKEHDKAVDIYRNYTMKLKAQYL